MYVETQQSRYTHDSAGEKTGNVVLLRISKLIFTAPDQ